MLPIMAGKQDQHQSSPLCTNCRHAYTFRPLARESYGPLVAFTDSSHAIAASVRLPNPLSLYRRAK